MNMEIVLLVGIFLFLVLSAPVEDWRYNKKRKQLDRIEKKLDTLLSRDILRESEHSRHESIQKVYSDFVIPFLLKEASVSPAKKPVKKKVTTKKK